MSNSKDNHCGLCDISYLAREELTEHYWSLMHHIKLEQRKKHSNHYCTLCFASCENLTAYSNHLNQEQHRKAILEERKMKLKDRDDQSVVSVSTEKSVTDSIKSQPTSRLDVRKGGGVFTERSEPYSDRSTDSYRKRDSDRNSDYNKQDSDRNSDYRNRNSDRNSDYRSRNSDRNSDYRNFNSSHSYIYNSRFYNNHQRGRSWDNHDADNHGNYRRRHGSFESSNWHRHNKWDNTRSGKGNHRSRSDYSERRRHESYHDRNWYSRKSDFTDDQSTLSRSDLTTDRDTFNDDTLRVMSEASVDSQVTSSEVTVEETPCQQRNRSRSPIKMKKSSPRSTSSGLFSSIREDKGQTLLNQAESLCRTLREKREMAKSDRELREAEFDKEEKRRQIDRKIKDYNDLCKSKIKGVLDNKSLDSDGKSTITQGDTISLALDETRETLDLSTVTESSLPSVISAPRKNLNHSSVTEASIPSDITRSLDQSNVTQSSVTSTLSARPSTGISKQPKKLVQKTAPSAKVNFVNKEMNRAQLMKMVNQPRSYKERRHLENILVNRPKKSRPKLNLQPAVASSQPVEELMMVELPPEIRIKVEKLLDEGPSDFEDTTELNATLPEMESTNRYNSTPILYNSSPNLACQSYSASDHLKSSSASMIPLNSTAIAVAEVDRKPTDLPSYLSQDSIDVRRSVSTPSTVVDTGCGESVVSVKQEPEWDPGYSYTPDIPKKSPTRTFLADNLEKHSFAEIQPEPVSVTAAHVSADSQMNVSQVNPLVPSASEATVNVTLENNPEQQQQPEIRPIGTIPPHPAFSGNSVLNKAASVLTLKGTNNSLQLNPLPNMENDPNQSMNQVLMITLREEQIRKNLCTIQGHVERCRQLALETQKEIEYFTNLHEYLIKEEVNLRQQRLDILKGAVNNTDISLPPIFSLSPAPPVSVPNLPTSGIQSSSASPAHVEATIPVTPSQSSTSTPLPLPQNQPNASMEYVGTLKSPVAADRLLHELSGCSSGFQEVRSSTPDNQDGLFAVPYPVVSDINTEPENTSAGRKRQKKKTSSSSKGTTDTDSSSTTSTLTEKKKKKAKKTVVSSKKKKKDVKKSKKEKKSKGKEKDSSSVADDLDSTCSSVSSNNTSMDIETERVISPILTDESETATNTRSQDIIKHMAKDKASKLNKLSDVRSHGQKEKIKAILLDTVDTTMQIPVSNTSEEEPTPDTERMFLKKISSLQTESVPNTPSTVVSSQISSRDHYQTRDCSVPLCRIEIAGPDEPDSPRKIPAVPRCRRVDSSSSCVDSSTGSPFDECSLINNIPDSNKVTVDRDVLVEAGVIFTHADAEQMLSDSTAHKSDDDHSLVSSTDSFCDKNSLKINLSSKGARIVHSVVTGFSEENRVCNPTPGLFSGHTMPIFNIVVFGNYLYTCSQDVTAKKFDLETHKCVMEFSGHTKAVHCIAVTSYPMRERLFTGGFDNLLIIHDTLTSEVIDKYAMDSKIHCMHQAWNHLYIGLEDGCVHCLDLKKDAVTDTFKCSDLPISAIASAREGIRKLLLVGSYDSIITIRDASTWLLLRTIEAHNKTPLCIKVHSTNVFSTSNDRTIQVHDLNTAGHVHTFDKYPGAMTCLVVHKNSILVSGADGLIRRYSIENFKLLQMFYGAGKSLVLDMLVHNDMIYTANSSGDVDAITFNPDIALPCQISSCRYKFGLAADLLYHITKDHLPATIPGKFTCPWIGCNLVLISESNVTDHMNWHVEDLEDSINLPKF